MFSGVGWHLQTSTQNDLAQDTGKAAGQEADCQSWTELQLWGDETTDQVMPGLGPGHRVPSPLTPSPQSQGSPKAVSQLY